MCRNVESEEDQNLKLDFYISEIRNIFGVVVFEKYFEN